MTAFYYKFISSYYIKSAKIINWPKLLTEINIHIFYGASIHDTRLHDNCATMFKHWLSCSSVTLFVKLTTQTHNSASAMHITWQAQHELHS